MLNLNSPLHILIVSRHNTNCVRAHKACLKDQVMLNYNLAWTPLNIFGASRSYTERQKCIKNDRQPAWLEDILNDKV